MEVGHIPDQDPAGQWIASWVSGPAKRSGLTKMKVAGRIPIRALRCAGCGYVELFAKGDFDPK